MFGENQLGRSMLVPELGQCSDLPELTNHQAFASPPLKD
jgi:hypothetical protein